MSMYRSYLLSQNFWAKKGSNQKVFIKHSHTVGGIYAILQSGENRGVKIIVEGRSYFFNNFDNLENFLNNLEQNQDSFMKILKRKNISQKLRMLEI
ncbi:MAG: hypothetical protein ACTSR8_14785 [Promethearchaeota archaeon]